MVDNLSGLGAIGPIKPSSDVQQKGKTQAGGKDFKEVLGDFLTKVNDMQNNADESIKKLASGEVKDLHQVMTALAEADVSFKMMMDIRNKLVDAYKQVMQMQM
jgi:flagellar hook-basal body complex protein FliE